MGTEERYLSPVYNIHRIPISKIRTNDYNPNRVAPTELKLLEQSNFSRRLYNANCLLL